MGIAKEIIVKDSLHTRLDTKAVSKAIKEAKSTTKGISSNGAIIKRLRNLIILL